MRGNGKVDSRSRLESFLAGVGGGRGGVEGGGSSAACNIDIDAGGNEFGEVAASCSGSKQESVKNDATDGEAKEERDVDGGSDGAEKVVAVERELGDEADAADGKCSSTCSWY